MKLIIFGSSGSIGRHLVSQAKAPGHEVTGFQRNPPTSDDNAPHRMVQGDVLDAAAAAAAVAGQDAVLVVIGNGRKGGLRAPGTAHIIAGMQAHGVRRLICQSTLGAGDSAGNLDIFWKYLMFGLLLRPAYADHQEQERLVRASGLDWTIVRPAAFTDGPAGDYAHGFPADKTGLFPQDCPHRRGALHAGSAQDRRLPAPNAGPLLSTRATRCADRRADGTSTLTIFEARGNEIKVMAGGPAGCPHPGGAAPLGRA